jgi:hypothetical protein
MVQRLYSSCMHLTRGISQPRLAFVIILLVSMKFTPGISEL